MEISIEIIKFINDETKDAKLNMKTHYIITYNNNQNYNKFNLGVTSKKIILLTYDNTYSYYGFICPIINFKFPTTISN